MHFVTIATFDTPPRAHLAVGLLQEAGIDAVLRNENIVAGAWDLGQASRGVEVQVPQPDAERAFEMVEQAEFRGGATGGDEPLLEASPFDDDDDSDESEEDAEAREDSEMASRAVRAAMFGFFLPPLQLYSLWLLMDLNVRLGADRRTPTIRRQMRNALLMDLFLLVTAPLVAISMLRG